MSHPGIVTISDARRDKEVICIAEELLEGRPLNEVIGEQRRARDKAADMGAQLAEAMAYAHGKGVVGSRS